MRRTFIYSYTFRYNTFSVKGIIQLVEHDATLMCALCSSSAVMSVTSGIISSSHLGHVSVCLQSLTRREDTTFVFRPQRGYSSAGEGRPAGYSDHVIRVQSWCIETRGQTLLIKHIEVE